jgi:hypothetical protein
MEIKVDSRIDLRGSLVFLYNIRLGFTATLMSRLVGLANWFSSDNDQ